MSKSQSQSESKRQSMPVEFDNALYEFNHGRAPRGYGMWAFANGDHFRYPRSIDFTFTGTLAEAKKAARAHFKGNACRVVVMP